MKKFVFSVASKAIGRLQIKPSGSGDENVWDLVSFAKGFSKHPCILAIFKVDSEYLRFPF